MSEHIDRDKLEGYVEQVLPVGERRMVEAHVTSCSICQARLAEAKQMTALLYSLPRAKPAPDLASRISAAVAAGRAQSAPATIKWTQMLTFAMFAAGFALLAMTLPQWIGWAGTAAVQWPNDQSVATWLANVVADPSLALDAVTAFASTLLTGAADDMGVLLTLATALLAAASLAGLAELLGGRSLVQSPELQV